MPLLRAVDLPPVWLALAVLLAYASAQFWPMPDVPVLGLAGRALIVAGAVLMAAALAQMVLGRTTFIPRRDPSALVSGGVFRLSRNPIYLADATILLGLILHWGAFAALPLVPAFAVLITRRFILGEEARLAAAFGTDYAAFRARTRRWL